MSPNLRLVLITCAVPFLVTICPEEPPPADVTAIINEGLGYAPGGARAAGQNSEFQWDRVNIPKTPDGTVLARYTGDGNIVLYFLTLSEAYPGGLTSGAGKIGLIRVAIHEAIHACYGGIGSTHPCYHLLGGRSGTNPRSCYHLLVDYNTALALCQYAKDKMLKERAGDDPDAAKELAAICKEILSMQMTHGEISVADTCCQPFASDPCWSTTFPDAQGNCGATFGQPGGLQIPDACNSQSATQAIPSCSEC